MWNMSSQTEKVVEVSTVAGYHCPNAPRITTTNDHDFSIGDIITYVNSGSTQNKLLV